MHFAGFECCPWVGDAEALKRHLARHARDDPDRLPRAPPDAARKDYVIACPGAGNRRFNSEAGLFFLRLPFFFKRVPDLSLSVS